MEEENENVVQVNTESNGSNVKKFDFKNIDYKKYLPYAGIALAVIILIIILVSIFGGGPKKAVKKFISGMNGKNASKVVDSMDFAGISAWKYSYNVEDFSDDDYEEFIENYKDVDSDDIKDQKSDAKDTMKDGFDELKDEYKSYKMKVENFKSVEKLGKNLYAVKAKISLQAKPKDKDEEEIDESSIMTFVVYKNKLVSAGSLGF